MSTTCLVTLPNSVVEKIEVDPRENARECLEKVCDILETLEVDYFGLQYVTNKGEQLWLNLRNPIGRQVQGSPPYRLRLRVKFYVQPYFLQQDSTRNVFYLSIRQDLLEGRLHVYDPDQAAVIGALIAQVELGDASSVDPSPIHYHHFLPQVEHLSLERLREEHERLEGVSRGVACSNLLEQVMALMSYGVEYYQVRDAAGQDLYMGVGPQGIALYERSTWKCVKQIEYSAVHQATHNGKGLELHLFQDTGSTYSLNLKLVSERSANGLYRCVTEVFSFYHCDTVRTAVSLQFSRDLKGMLASLFNENTTLGKNYVFDIERTMREAYDHTRRRLYKMQRSSSTLSEEEECMCTCTDLVHGEDCSLQRMCQIHPEHYYPANPERREDNTTCCVCMDSDIDCVFTPCNHIVCCMDCSQRLDSCPVCRAHIDSAQVAFPSQLPWTRSSQDATNFVCAKL